MSTLAHPHTTNPTRSQSSDGLEENVVDVLRHGDTDAFSKGSAYSACLFPILEALGKSGINRGLLESMPHFANKLDLTDLRNILVNQGYVSDAATRQINAIPAELYPVLFIDEDETPLVLTERDNDTITFFDTTTRDYRSAPAELMKRQGTAYLFTDRTPTHGVKQRQESIGWFNTLLSRFRGMIWQLLLIGVVKHFVTTQLSGFPHLNHC